ncbi:hypothetical protein GCG21_13670 [Pseudactinotalea sp. HY160]|uniref:deoxynucleotide monophosphate kinase family protein n=1 Tax=Pseudactinotalea sp. HY160 TaxID=2654490 RepID=UPI00128C8869|nr:hypothetical protein [Pseudactinotalea sp. HY160]MPV51035.1 hypothetical protein [Pseudactinotalea sp. HY160]
MTTPPHPLIGLTGYKKAGKDTVAEMLGVIAGYERYAFADGVREALYTLDPLIGGEKSLRALVDASGWDAAKRHRIYGPEVTRLMQVLGTEVGQSFFGKGAWIQVLASELDSAGGPSTAHPVVVTDVRYAHEAQWLIDNGGLIWRVERPGTGPVGTHSSERPLDEKYVHRRIPNDSTRSALSLQIAAALEHAPVMAAHPAAAAA